MSQVKDGVLSGQREPTQPSLGYKKSKRGFLKKVILKLSFPEWHLICLDPYAGSHSLQTIVPHAPDGMGEAQKGLERKTVNSYLLSP